MRHDLEKYLWDNFGLDELRQKPFAVDVIADMLKKGMIKNEKQAYRTLEKWNDKGWVNYGTSLRCCWKEKKD